MPKKKPSERIEKIEFLAAKLAYECGLGASEWESFVEIAKKQLGVTT